MPLSITATEMPSPVAPAWYAGMALMAASPKLVRNSGVSKLDGGGGGGDGATGGGVFWAIAGGAGGPLLLHAASAIRPIKPAQRARIWTETRTGPNMSVSVTPG